MNRFLAGVVVALAISVPLFGSTGCVKTGTVTEKQPFTATLASYKTASIEVDVPDSTENSSDVKNDFTAAIGDSLRDKKVFGDLPPIGGDMTVRITVVSVDSGNKFLQAVGNSGDAEVKASVELVDTKQRAVIGAFDVTGNSKSNTETRVGGISTKAFGSATNTALEKAAEQIAEYLDSHRAGVPHGG